VKIWVDDIRYPPPGWAWAKNSDMALRMLDILRLVDAKPEVVSLDHDLGGDDTSRRIVLWFCEHDWWPVEVRVHSANPVGVEWLEGMISRYKI